MRDITAAEFKDLCRDGATRALAQLQQYNETCTMTPLLAMSLAACLMGPRGTGTDPRRKKPRGRRRRLHRERH